MTHLVRGILPASVVGTDGNAQGPLVEMRSLSEAVRDMGPLAVFFVCGVLMVLLGGVWFLWRVLRHRRRMRSMAQR